MGFNPMLAKGKNAEEVAELTGLSLEKISKLNLNQTG
jgi:hypothetical protein